MRCANATYKIYKLKYHGLFQKPILIIFSRGATLYLCISVRLSVSHI